MMVLKRSLLLITVLLLTGCMGGSNGYIPVDNRTQHAGEIPKQYVVKRGDSLYMIAMEFDLNHLDLARWNGIRSPYTIHRGQVLRLRPPPKQAQQKKRVASKKPVTRCSGSYYRVKRGDSLGMIADRCGLSQKKLARWNGLRSPYTIQVGQKLRLKPTSGRQKKVAPPKKSTQVATRSSASSKSSSGSSRLKRPVTGKIVKRFAPSKGVSGVEFSGKRGSPVRAAAGGKVVYSGTGLVRYGKLLIVKHDNGLLTAYAHNSALQVSEGDIVKAGQQIAKMGSSGTDRVKLHFEVRRGGKPVDPMRYLK